MFAINRPDGSKRKVLAAKRDRCGRHRRSIESSKARIAVSAVVCNASRNQRVCNLHQDSARACQSAGNLPIHAPEDRRRSK
jgi:hypothetical protein